MPFSSRHPTNMYINYSDVTSFEYIDALHLNMWNLNTSINKKAKGKSTKPGIRCRCIHYTLIQKQWMTSFRSLPRLSLAVWHCKHNKKSFDTWMAVLYTELWCQCLIAHQHSPHLLCLSLHNYTSWSCFLSPPDHLFPAANLLSVPASASTSSPHWVNLSIDIIFSLSPFLSSSSLSHKHARRKHNRTPKQKSW